MESSARVVVHPVVLLSIADAYERRNEGPSQVIGTLLGNFEKGLIEVTNSYAIPHRPADVNVYFDMEFNWNMLKMEKKINQNDRPVGWYTTGKDISEQAKFIHQNVYIQSFKDAIILLVDTDLDIGEKMSVKAFRSRTVGVPGGTKGVMFLPMDVRVECSDTESIAVHMMAPPLMNQRGDQPEMGNDLAYLCRLSDQLRVMLDQVLTYVEQVVQEKIPMDNAIGRAISQLILSIPKLNPDLIDSLINSSFRDLLMITYLTNLIKTHLKLLNLAN